MHVEQDTIERIIGQVMAERASGEATSKGEASGPCEKVQDVFMVPVGVSNRHIHLSKSDLDSLFGPGAVLHRKKAMKQPGQFAADETVTLRGPKGELKKVRVLGPVRPETQVEISVADGFALGIQAPLRLSGDLEETPGLEIVGPIGSVRKERGLIVALRHIHISPETASLRGLKNGDEVDIEVPGDRAGVMRKVAIRISSASALELHIDMDEANAFCLKNDDLVRVRLR